MLTCFQAVKQMRFDHKLVLGYLLTLERSLAVETLVTLGRETKRRYKRAKVRAARQVPKSLS